MKIGCVRQDIVTPGIGIRSTYPGNSYESLDGTSMVTGLAGIILTHSDLRDRTAQFLDNASEEFEALLPSSTSEITLTKDLYDEADKLARDLAAAGDHDFQEEMLETWEDLALEQHIGEKAIEIWDGMNRNVVYLPIIIK